MLLLPKHQKKKQQDKDTTVVVDNGKGKFPVDKRSKSLDDFGRETDITIETGNCFQVALLDDSTNQNVDVDVDVEEDENTIDKCFEREFSVSEDLLEESNKWVQKIRSQNFYDDKKSVVMRNFGNGTPEIRDSLIQSHAYELISSKETISDDLIVENIDEDIESLMLKKVHPTKTFEFNDLPDELKIRIFSYFTKRQLCSCVAPVCLSWFQLAKDPLFWTEIYKTDFEAVKSFLLIKVILSWCKQLTLSLIHI